MPRLISPQLGNITNFGNAINTGVIQMMLPVLSSEYFVYYHMQTLLSSEYMVDSQKYDTSDFAVVRDMIRPSIYSDDSKLLHAMVY